MLKNTLILVPTQMEIAELSESFASSMVIRKSCYEIHFSATQSARRVLYLVCGVGLVHASMACMFSLCQFSIDHVFLLGIGGCGLNSGLKPSDIAMAKTETFLDFGDGTDEFTRRVCIHPFLSSSLVMNCVTPSSPWPVVSFGSTDLISDRHRFGNFVENMEGAAVARVCESFSIPFTQIRTIANWIADPREKWQISSALKSLKEVGRWLFHNL